MDMIFIEEKQIQIKSFEKNDFKIVKNFILECHKDMTNQDFFIIDDIEIALPAMFTDTGAVYGAYYDGELIAVHGVDFSHNNHKLISQHISSYITDKPLAEMGWTMIKKAFQGHNIATFLIKESEKIVFHRFDLIATGHPQNVAALKAYINNGYYGVTLTDYYSKPRIFLLKRTSSQLRYQNVITECLLTDIGSDHFLNKNMLIRIVKKNDKYYGQFAKALEE